MDAQARRTTLIVANIHCPSCVSAIQSILAAYTLPSEQPRGLHRHLRSITRSVDSLKSLRPMRSASPDRSLDGFELHSPAFTDVDVSILNGTISFTHPASLVLRDAVAELQDAGYEIVKGEPHDLERHGQGGTHHHRAAPGSSPWARFADLFRAPPPIDREQAHKENCEACREEEAASSNRDEVGAKEHNAAAGGDTGARREPIRAIFSIEGMTCTSCTSSLESALNPEKNPGILSVQVLLVDDSATVVFDPHLTSEEDIIATIEDLGFEATCVSKASQTAESKSAAALGSHTRGRHEGPDERGYRIKLSIEGMTCASCTGAISNLLKGMAGVSDYDVDLMSGSGVATVATKEMAGTVQSEIEDLGYDCKIMSVTSLAKEHTANDAQPTTSSQDTSRTVDVRIEGFFCEHCPAKANRVLEDLSKRFDISYTQSTLQNPASTLTYIADPPAFTLRTIRSAITKLGFTLSIVKPETLQDRARLAQKRERQRILIRLIICILFCIPTFIIGVVIGSLLREDNAVRMFFHGQIWGGASRLTVALFILATPIQFGVGQFFYKRAFKSLRGVWRKRRGRVDMRKVWVDRLLRWGSMDTLVSLGTTIAWASSLAYMVLDIVGLGSGEMAYFDTSVFLITFILAGRYLESVSKARTGDAILELGKLRPKKGLLFFDDKPAEEVESEFLEIGDRLLIPVGQSPPVDCVLAQESSSTSFDEASLTGESRPVAKKAGDVVYAGTFNAGPSAAVALVQKRDGETVIDSIAAGVRDAMSKKASIERLADAVTAVFVPCIVAVGCLTFVVWLLRAYIGNLPEEWLDSQRGSGGWVLFSLQFTVACLVVACPCGIGLAAPTAQLVGVGLAARHGIMPNGGGEAFQTFTHIDAIAFDKTGTITKGKFQVSDHEVFTAISANLLWRLVIAVEQASSHPIALAINAFAKDRLDSTTSETERSGAQPKILDIEEVPGRGMRAVVEQLDGKSCEVHIGNEKMLLEAGCEVQEDTLQKLRLWQGQGKSVVLVGIKDLSTDDTVVRLASALAVVDPLRPEAFFVLDYFRSRGIAVYLVSGDGPATVKAVARTLNLPEDHVVGGALPDDKQRFVQDLQGQIKRVRGWNGRLQEKRKLVAFVGDGINDSIALAQADVSIAQGGGSQAATSTADFALLSESLLSIITLQAIARSTYRRIISNFGWACVYNIILIPLAAGAFYNLGQTKLPAVCR